jgi:hypothetical protein
MKEEMLMKIAAAIDGDTTACRHFAAQQKGQGAAEGSHGCDADLQSKQSSFIQKASCPIL